MLDSSDDEDELELEYKMSDEEYDLYYHDELFVNMPWSTLSCSQ